MALRSGSLRALREEADLVAHAGAAQVRDAECGHHRLRVLERREVVAARLDNEADHVALLDVERALLDQPRVHDGVEERVIDDVVEVAVGVVVHPPRGHDAPVGILVERCRRRTLAAGHPGVGPSMFAEAASRIAFVTRNFTVRRYAPGTVENPPAMNASTSSRCASVSR